MTNNTQNAMLVVSLMDLTSLNTDDNQASINALVNSVDYKLGIPAAVCVFSEFVDDAKIALANRLLSHVKVATVTNFPTGDAPLNEVLNETLIAIERGADEIDLVIPYKALIKGEADTVLEYVSESKKACGSRAKLKVIIESGELKTPALIAQATELAIQGGADFVKTSTGKVGVNATLEATEIMLNAIKKSSKPVGFKAAGGVKTTGDANAYLQLTTEIMGHEYLAPETFRFGASSLLNDVYKVLHEAQQ
ncbi:deoxyribose-phosphate aldolase [Pseudoalteromonas sp. S1610]|uniref:deoxyribose-phosphate aldolase n=1 Tax=Pseudoalteromonas sp. S1610 TaxID=579506 RepID=UPI00110AA1D6|nr:deoxyribose-phosphate aldolase [Pseudoalteromonas sp. S1610]TMP58520.1 deoxyribose-phosphate aldolase [Pseudoalteromonas sp. S1610]